MKKLFKRSLAIALTVIMSITAVPLTGLKGLSDFFPQAQAVAISGKPIWEFKKWDVIYFGSYPQSEVKDTATVNALNKMAKDWKSDSYYSYDSKTDSIVQGERMKFCDVTYNRLKYRGVCLKNTYYWFSYALLEWIVLDPDKGLVLSTRLIDSQPYQSLIYRDSNVYYNNPENTVYANDYVTSSIRKWLNDDFYNTAFTSQEKAKIDTTELSNTAYPASYRYNSNATNDKIFLMSYYDMIDDKYGFRTDDEYFDNHRQASSTDYAKKRGIYVSGPGHNSPWWLRSPGSHSSRVCNVEPEGYIGFSTTYNSFLGVRPALKFNMHPEISESDNLVENMWRGNIIEFGSYPQSKVTDKSIINNLNNISKIWKSYGYYSGNNSFGSMVQGDWMKYCDVEYDGEKYRGVYFTQYRPKSTHLDNYEIYSYQYQHRYYINTCYWFKFEPLKWRVIDPNEGFVLSESLIDSQPYQNLIYGDPTGAFGEYYNDPEKTVYASDYTTSSIRKWLNDDFYNTAFTTDEKSKIGITALGNFVNDKIFLMSWDEMIDFNYGFSTSDGYDLERRAKNTDYSKSQGAWRVNAAVYNGNEYWWLRNPGNYSICACAVRDNGSLTNSTIANQSSFGVRPALKFNGRFVICEFHSEELIAGKPASCTETGLTDGTRCSVCGEILNAQEIIPATGHTEVLIAGKPATCTEPGLTEGAKCSVCGKVLNEQATISAIGHTKEKIPYKAPTCTDTGLTEGTKCSVCGKILKAQKIIPATGHIEVLTAGKPATCTNVGFTDGAKCFICGEIIKAQEIIPAKGHTEVIIAGNPATCTDGGFTEGVKCSVCGKILKEQTVIPALGHISGEWQVISQASCSEYGRKDKRCTVCGELIESDITDKTPHTLGDWLVTIPAEIGKTGEEARFCNICGEKAEIRIIPALNNPNNPTDPNPTDPKPTAPKPTEPDPTVPKPDYILGDVNGDKKITSVDARKALRIALKLESASGIVFLAADVNSDKKVTSQDARIILRVALKLQKFD